MPEGGDKYYNHLVDALKRAGDGIKPGEWDGKRICVGSCPSRGLMDVRVGMLVTRTTGCMITQQPVRDDGPLPPFCSPWYMRMSEKEKQDALPTQ